MSPLKLSILFVIGLVLAPPCLAADEDDDLVREFKVYYGADKTEAERWEAIKVLDGIDSVGAAKALLLAFEDEAFTVRQAAVEAVTGMKDPAVAQYLVEEILDNRKYSKNELVLTGAAEAAGGMGDPIAFEPLAQLLGHKDIGVKLGAAAGLGHLGDLRACEPLTELAADRDGAVARAALEALVDIGDRICAEAAVLGAMEHADWRVRARAVQAVVDVRLKSGIRPLIERMKVEEGRLAGDAYTALKSMTLRDFQDDPAPWEAWWDRNENRWDLPDYEAVEAARKKERLVGTQYTQGQTEFLGVDTKSEAILFVIDVSDSMDTPFGDPERLRQMGREYKSLQRLAIVKEELTSTVAELPESTMFNIVSFATGVDPWKKDLVRANVLNKNNAASWIQKLKPLGGAAAGFRARTGLSDIKANDGQTNTYLALMTALGEDVGDDRKKGPETYKTEGRSKTPVDTIFFLTDGEPTVGKTTDINKIRAEVRRANQYMGVQIHVIFVGAFGGDDLKLLAEENGGMFVSIGG